jgi:hypothetical protein
MSNMPLSVECGRVKKGSDEVIIPHRLGDEGFVYLYSIKDTSLIARHLLSDKTHWKSCEIIPCDEPTMMRIWTHHQVVTMESGKKGKESEKRERN